MACALTLEWSALIGLSSTIRVARLFLATGLLIALVGSITACETTSERVGFTHSDGVRRVTPEQAKMLVDSGRAVLVDTRGPLAFVGSHAADAISAPASEIDQNPVGVFARVPQDKELILYCT